MKIVLVIHHRLTKDAGAAGVVLSLASEYRNLGHDVAILSHDAFKLPNQLRKILFPLFCASMLWKHHRHADVIDASSGTAWIYFRLARQRGRGLYVAHSHGLAHVMHDVLMANVRAGRTKVSWKYFLFNGTLALYQDKASYRFADLALFLNRADTQYAVERLGVPARNAKTVPNGLSEAFLDAANALAKSVQPRRDRVVQVGSFTQRKGVRTTSGAMKLVIERRPNTWITYLGTQISHERIVADYPPAMRAYVQVIPSFQNSALPTLLAQHQIFIMPSQSEGFGIAALEAMACGLVPIVTDIPGPTEFIRHRVNGLIVPVNDPDALATAILELIDDGDLYERLREEARVTASALRWTSIAAQRVELYRTCLDQLKSETKR